MAVEGVVNDEEFHSDIENEAEHNSGDGRDEVHG
jgi:hypothetical protein